MKTRVSVFAKCVCMAILGFVTAVPAQAGLMHNVTPDQEYLDFADSFPSVGWFATVDSGVTGITASAVLIHPNWVLTAAHAVLKESNQPTSFYEGYRVGFTNNFFEGPGENQFANAVYVHPDYNDFGAGPDLALLYFENAFLTASSDVLYYGDPIVGAEYHLVGFGRDGTPATGLQPRDGNRRAGTNLLTDYDIPEGYMRARFLSPSETGFQELGILGTPGDSGGGWFTEIDGELHLAGITSFWGGFAGYGGRTSATYFDSDTRIWIESTMQSHAVPEPSSLVLAALGAGFGGPLLRRRKRNLADV